MAKSLPDSALWQNAHSRAKKRKDEGRAANLKTAVYHCIPSRGGLSVLFPTPTDAEGGANPALQRRSLCVDRSEDEAGDCQQLPGDESAKLTTLSKGIKSRKKTHYKTLDQKHSYSSPLIIFFSGTLTGFTCMGTSPSGPEVSSELNECFEKRTVFP